jgi:GAF domain-containing protein
MLDNNYSAVLAEERRLRAAVEQDLNLRLRQQEAIAWLGEHALTCQSLDEVFEAAVRVVADTLTMEFCKILEHLPAENALLLRSGVGWAGGLVGSTLIGAERNSQAGFTLINVEPVIVDNLAAETRFTDLQLLTDHHVVSGMGVVIPGIERPFGVLSVHSAQHRKFVLQDTRFIKAIAGLLASAIQRFSSEEDLRRSRNELAIILQGINEGVTVQDRSGKLVYANQAAAEFMGFASVEEVLRTELNDVRGRFRLFNEQGQPFLLDDMPGRQVLRWCSARIGYRPLSNCGQRPGTLGDCRRVAGVGCRWAGDPGREHLPRRDRSANVGKERSLFGASQRDFGLFHRLSRDPHQCSPTGCDRPGRLVLDCLAESSRRSLSVDRRPQRLCKGGNGFGFTKTVPAPI